MVQSFAFLLDTWLSITCYPPPSSVILRDASIQIYQSSMVPPRLSFPCSPSNGEASDLDLSLLLST